MEADKKQLFMTMQQPIQRCLNNANTPSFNLLTNINVKVSVLTQKFLPSTVGSSTAIHNSISLSKADGSSTITVDAKKSENEDQSSDDNIAEIRIEDIIPEYDIYRYKVKKAQVAVQNVPQTKVINQQIGVKLLEEFDSDAFVANVRCKVGSDYSQTASTALSSAMCSAQSSPKAYQNKLEVANTFGLKAGGVKGHLSFGSDGEDEFYELRDDLSSSQNEEDDDFFELGEISELSLTRGNGLPALGQIGGDRLGTEPLSRQNASIYMDIRNKCLYL